MLAICWGGIVICTVPFVKSAFPSGVALFMHWVIVVYSAYAVCEMVHYPVDSM